MCGRYFLHSTAEQLTRLFGEMDAPVLQARYNIAPTQSVPVVRQSANRGRELVAMRWGLIPSWSKGPDRRFSMINARVETVAGKPAYRSAFRRRRCLLPADGFYEWRQQAGGKQPWVLRPRDRRPLALAGLWECWRDPDGNAVESCAILVGAANPQVAPVHERMPATLAPEAFGPWLDPAQQRSESALELLAAQQMPELSIYPVSRRVNSPANDDESLLEAIEDPD